VAALVGFAVLCTLALVVDAKYPFTWTVVGDWGLKIRYADKIAARSKKAGSKFVTAIGDNFYNYGVKNLEDPLFKKIYEKVWSNKWFKTHKWYVIAGNHDYRGNLTAQIEYSKRSKSWTFPSLYYKVSRKLTPTESVDLIFLDTTPFAEGNGDPKQVLWLEKQLKNSKAKWIIVTGHHQIYSLRENEALMVQHIRPLIKKYKVAAFINGHHHTLEHHVEKGMHYIGIGNTAQSAYPSRMEVEGDAKTKFVFPTKKQYKKLGRSGCHGFGTISLLSKSTLQVSFYGVRSNLLYTFKVKNPRA
jgi:predicted phosphodiesterase